MGVQDGFRDGVTTLERPNPFKRFLAYFAGHPLGFWFFFWGEFAERSSYYGMRAILTLYMADQLGLGRQTAGTWMAWFIAACYFLPLVGGYVADNFLGKYWTIVGFSIPYILGHVILGFQSIPFLIIALCLLAMGTGVIKPNISTLMGMTYDQQRPGQDLLCSDAFALFYWSINIGAALSSFVMPVLRDSYGYQIAFLFPAALMVVAFLIFAIGKPFYAVEVIVRTRKTPEQRTQQLLVLGRILGVFSLIVFFWSVFDQQPTTWIFFAQDHVNLDVSSWHIPPDQIQTLNAVLILVLLPPSTLFWRALAKRGLHLRATDKMVLGFILTGATMALRALAAFVAGDAKVSILWEVGAFFLITCAEVCISPVGLELAFLAAPKAMKGFVTACFLLTVAGGDIINTRITRLYEPFGPTYYFAMETLIMVPVTIAFIFVAHRFNRASERWTRSEVGAPTIPAVAPVPPEA